MAPLPGVRLLGNEVPNPQFKRPRFDVNYCGVGTPSPAKIAAAVLLPTTKEWLAKELAFVRQALASVAPVVSGSVTAAKDERREGEGVVSSVKPSLPSSLIDFGLIQGDTSTFRGLLERHGFRTSLVSSPQIAISVYKDSFLNEAESENKNKNEANVLQSDGDARGTGRQFLTAMFGMDPKQDTLEWLYASFFKAPFCLFLLCRRLRATCPESVKNETFVCIIQQNESFYRSLASMECPEALDRNAVSLADIARRASNMLKLAAELEPRVMLEQLQREYKRILVLNSTLSNALLQIFTEAHACHFEDIFLKRSHAPIYERITIHLYDPNKNGISPPPFSFLPSLSLLLREGVPKVVDGMIQSVWIHLLKYGYFATPQLKEECRSDLFRYFSAAIVEDDCKPIPLIAHFDPKTPLAWYLKGEAGAGKSSLARHLPSALEATITEHVDPEILVRFVKQNMNKPQDVLEVEFELRPNNNDLSVMGVIQGRRLSMTQTKPGIVVLDLEEMPSNATLANPNQSKVAQLISQRFTGRKGSFQPSAMDPPRNSDNRGIHTDMSLVTLFTSNYDLDDISRVALQRLKIFQHLKSIEITAISGSDRRQFALAYLQQRIKDQLYEFNPHCYVAMRISPNQGDTRPLIRLLRMIAFHVCSLVSESIQVGGVINAEVIQNEGVYAICANGNRVMVRLGTFQNLYPTIPRAFDVRTGRIVSELRSQLTAADSSSNFCDDLSTLLDYWLSKTLAPVVITSSDKSKIRLLMKVVSCFQCQRLHCIPNVDAGSYKMMKSLADTNDTPNLRDDILKCGSGATVAVELHCPTTDAQVCIRELIEDSPSMTAFSTTKSALHKSGLLFLTHVNGEITPEILSRTSLVI